MTDVLKDELANDPFSRGYDSMSDQAAANDLNTEYRTRNRVTMTASEVFNSIDKTEFNALSAADKALVWNILHLGEINPFGHEAVVFMVLFPNGGSTLSALAADRKQPITRAQELRLSRVKPGHVEEVRRG